LFLTEAEPNFPAHPAGSLVTILTELPNFIKVAYIGTLRTETEEILISVHQSTLVTRSPFLMIHSLVAVACSFYVSLPSRAFITDLWYTLSGNSILSYSPLPISNCKHQLTAHCFLYFTKQDSAFPLLISPVVISCLNIRIDTCTKQKL
jgi:hypothetical protein